MSAPGSAAVLTDRSLEMRSAAKTFVHWLNSVRGGLRVNGSRLAMRLAWVDDGGSKLQVANATAWALRNPGFPADFAVGPYTSGLTQYAARQADADGKLMVSAGASYTYVFKQGLSRLFGLFPHSWELTGLRVIKRAAAERDAAASLYPSHFAEDLCGGASCVAQLKFGMLGQGCDATALGDAEELFGAPSHLEAVTDESPGEELRLALQNLKSSAVTILFVCGLKLKTIVEATRLMSEAELGFEPYAMMAFGMASRIDFLDEFNGGWWQGGHFIEPTVWHWKSETQIRGAFSGITSQEFYSMFYDYWKVAPAYCAAAQFCALCALCAAIEQADSLESEPVAFAMRNLSSLIEFYAPSGIRFNQDGQLNQDLFLLQAPAVRRGPVAVVHSPDGSVERSLVFPKPPWALQKCRYDTSENGVECSGHGRCHAGGKCLCDPGWLGNRCEVEAASNMLIIAGSSALAVVLILAACVVWLMPKYRKHLRKLEKLELQSLEAAIEADDRVVLERFENGQNLTMTRTQVKDQMRLLLCKVSEHAGISAAYLLSKEFSDMARKRSGKEDPSFYDLTDAFFLGEDAIGACTVCPRDGKLGCAFVDTLPAKHRRRCTHFLSWWWGYTLSLVQDALRQFLIDSELDGEEVFFSMCFFVNNQYRILVNKDRTGSENLAHTFEDNLTRIGHVVALLDTWDGPRYLSRIWTIFEQATAMKLNVPVTIILPTAESQSLLRQLELGKEGIVRVRTAMTKVDSKMAQATVQEDEDAVKTLIKSTFIGGFKYVDAQIVKFMVHWMGKEMEAHLNTFILNDNGHRVRRTFRSERSSQVTESLDEVEDLPINIHHIMSSGGKDPYVEQRMPVSL
uniref:EGF-like domain-containing protein n=1 Tax=Alexandrium catenella TaxID=2925 RepID=A0A7S1LIX5_ALECA